MTTCALRARTAHLMMPQTVTVTIDATTKATADVKGAFLTTSTGINGLFAAIIIGLIATTIFIKLSGVEKLKVNLGEGVPPAVADSFNVMGGFFCGTRQTQPGQTSLSPPPSDFSPAEAASSTSVSCLMRLAASSLDSCL